MTLAEEHWTVSEETVGPPLHRKYKTILDALTPIDYTISCSLVIHTSYYYVCRVNNYVEINNNVYVSYLGEQEINN
ncbi:uncharacterized protein LOC110116971 isoform X1 [Athalia rosae]|uniref:uncharacterized protein LOC110116971 isoform X1 n=1 Tax=Athalia rosae TaxID=37344 RepID=UPI0020332E59|nr:uncharacterized protein LOC110116971 isoform X1 [Athalia rosae]